MCLIIDANCAVETLCARPSSAFAPVMKAIQNDGAVMVLGGSKLRTEYQKLTTVWRFIVALDRAGKARTYSDSAVDDLENDLIANASLKSDDPHIIALAQISGARLLCSKDKALHDDFGEKRLIDKPRGSVYQNETHASLLKKCCT